MRKLLKKKRKALRKEVLGVLARMVALRQRLSANEKGLFIDGGSNLGQGYYFFKKYFPPKRYHAVLFEPNPYCMNVIKSKYKDIKHVEFFEKAIWIREEKLKFYGLVEDKAGNTFSGASVMETHNSAWYEVDKERAIEVEAISLSDFLTAKRRIYNKIIMKMDIESAEYEVLQDLIDKNTITHLDHLFVEFHSKYFEQSLQSHYQKLEKELVQVIRSKGVGVTIWV